MQPFETWLKADLQAPVTVKRIDGNLFSGDNQGNLVGVTVTDAGEPATLSGEVRGYFIRSDGNTVIMSGTIDGNKVTVVLPSACYTVVGQFSLVIKVGQVAVGACTGYVYQSNTDSTVDPEHVIPDIDQLLTRVEALEGRATTLEGDVSAQNNTINAIEDGLAIIATGNVHPAIANGQFVYVKGHSSLAEGLYRATAAIGTNATLSTSNLTADGSGGLNALKGEVDSLNSNIETKALQTKLNLRRSYISCATTAEIESAVATQISEMVSQAQTSVIGITVSATGQKLAGGIWNGLLFKGDGSYYSCLFYSYSGELRQYVYLSGTKNWYKYSPTAI